MFLLSMISPTNPQSWGIELVDQIKFYLTTSTQVVSFSVQRKVWFQVQSGEKGRGRQMVYFKKIYLSPLIQQTQDNSFNISVFQSIEPHPHGRGYLKNEVKIQGIQRLGTTAFGQSSHFFWQSRRLIKNGPATNTCIPTCQLRTTTKNNALQRKL